MSELLSKTFGIHRFRSMSRTRLRSAKARQIETDHRIANHIQFAAAVLRHESRYIDDVESARLALSNAIGRLNAIAQIHLQLTRDLPETEVGLEQFLEPFCKSVFDSIGATFIVTAPGVTLHGPVAAQICVLLNEMAMNTVKHGKHGGAPVHLTLTAEPCDNDRLRLSLRDNGAGFPDDFCLGDSCGLGMTIITSTVEKLGGSIRALAGQGAGFEIELPRAHNGVRQFRGNAS